MPCQVSIEITLENHDCLCMRMKFPWHGRYFNIQTYTHTHIQKKNLFKGKTRVCNAISLVIVSFVHRQCKINSSVNASDSSVYYGYCRHTHFVAAQFTARSTRGCNTQVNIFYLHRMQACNFWLISNMNAFLAH